MEQSIAPLFLSMDCLCGISVRSRSCWFTFVTSLTCIYFPYNVLLIEW